MILAGNSEDAQNEVGRGGRRERQEVSNGFPVGSSCVADWNSRAPSVGADSKFNLGLRRGEIATGYGRNSYRDRTNSVRETRGKDGVGWRSGRDLEMA